MQIGTVVKAGSKSGHAVGTRVGIGAQGSSCLECEWCEAGKEQFCINGMGGTYQGRFEDGSIAQGGYADYTCQRGRFAIPIPDGLDSAMAAPLMCAGATVYWPHKCHGAGPGKKVAVVGIGGLGHLAVCTLGLSRVARCG
jgi:alcohol dehydrogenase (NADP+)